MSEEKDNIDYEVFSRQILIPSKNIFSFFDEYNDLYNFWFNLLFKNIITANKFFKRFDEWI